jgi:hypothetical protein
MMLVALSIKLGHEAFYLKKQVAATCEHSQYKIDKKVKGYATYPSPDPYPTG